MEARKLTLKIVALLVAALAFTAPRAQAIPPGFKFCVQYCPTSPLYTYHSCWMHCYFEWCKSSVPPQWREGCRTLLHPGISAGLLVKDAELATGFEVTDTGLPYFDFTGRGDLHLTAADLREDSNPAQAIAVWYLPAGAPDAEWMAVGKGSRSAAGDWDLLVVLDPTGDRSPTGTIAFEVQRAMPSEQDAPYALCPVLHAPKVTFDGLSNYALGAATISVEDDGTGERRLPVRNLGSSGEDGVAIDLRSSGSRFRPAFFDVFFEVAPDSQPDASLNAQVLQGDVDGDGIDEVLAHARADAAAEGVDLKVKFPWLPEGVDVTRSLQLFLGDVPVGSVNGVHGEDVGRAMASSSSPKPWFKDIHIHFDPFWIELTWTGVLSVDRVAASSGADIAVAGQVIHCDRLRVSLDGVSPPRSKLSSFLLTASGISSITVTGESVRSSPPVVVDGIPHHALGNADVSLEDDGTGERRLPVRNLGSSGEDGVAFDLGANGSRFRPAFFDVFFEAAVTDPRTSRMAARVTAADLDGDGRADVVADASATGTEAGVELRNTFPWAAPDAPMSLSYYLGTTLVGKSSTTNGAVVGLVVADPSDPQAQVMWPKDVHIQFLDHFPWIIITWTFTGLDSSTARGAGGSTGAWMQLDGTPVLIDRLEMSTAGGSLPGAVELDSLDLTASGIPEIVITGEAYGELVSEPSFRRGDANGDRRVDIGDSIFLLGYMFTGSRAPECMDAADVNDTGKVDLSDPISALNYLFLGAKAPPAPGVSTCGTDPTTDTLACGAYTTCS
jgi:hypothetical protein